LKSGAITARHAIQYGDPVVLAGLAFAWNANDLLARKLERPEAAACSPQIAAATKSQERVWPIR
jgi:hypothetical protein